MATKQDCLNQIDRIEDAKAGLADAIQEKGVEVPEQARINDYPNLVRQIQAGSPDAVLFTPQELTPEQQGQARANIAAGPEYYTVTYNVTTKEELRAAYGAGKTLILYDNGRVAPLVYYRDIRPNGKAPDPSEIQAIFECAQQDVIYCYGFGLRGATWMTETYSLDEYLKYTAQSLTDAQKEQARTNIGAGTGDGTYSKPNGGIPETDLESGVQTLLGKANTALQPAALEPITELIPEQASAQNQLADKNFVNSSVATNTANYISDNGQPFTSVADLEAYSGTLTNNDYAFVVGTDTAGNTTYTRYKYNATTGQWAAEYVLNNSSFTAEQWAAISSGITALLVQKLSDLPTEVVTYVTQTLTDAQKQQARTNIGATAPEIFWATYGTTTPAQIEAALTAGKQIFVKEGNYVYHYAGTDSSYYYFTCLWSLGYDRNVRLRISNNVWSIQTATFEVVANKTDDIASNNTSTSKYPNTKAVADFAVQALTAFGKKVWGGSQADYDLLTPANDTIYFIIPTI